MVHGVRVPSSPDQLPPDTRTDEEIIESRGTRVVNGRIYVAPRRPVKEWGKFVWIFFAVLATVLIVGTAIEIKMMMDAPGVPSGVTGAVTSGVPASTAVSPQN